MNTSSQVSIYNMALAAVGVSRFVQSPTEGSLQANTCNVFWQSVIDQCLQKVPWGFAMRFSALQEITKVTPGWHKTYSYPADCLQARSIVHHEHHRHWRESKIPYAVVENEAGGGLAIATNHPTPTLAYTARINNMGLWSPAFVNTVVLLLASKIVAPLSANPKYAETAGKAYEAAMLDAAALSMNESSEREELESEFITAMR